MHDLAAQLACTVRELLQRMDSRELTDWLAWMKLGSRDTQIVDLHAAQHTALVYNTNRAKGEPAAKAEDFALCYKPPPPPLTAEKIKLVFAGVNAIAEARGRAKHG